MGETFRPIFPWMRGSICANVILPPALRRAVVVMALQRLRIILLLVAEERAKPRQIGRAAQQDVPVMVADLVTEVADQGAVRLVHLCAPGFPLGVVSFGDVQSDLAF